MRLLRRQRGLGEALIDDLAHTRVARRIGHDQHLAESRLLRHCLLIGKAVVERDPTPLGTERERIAVNVKRVLVAGNRPIAGVVLVVPMHGSLLAQDLPGGMGVAVHEQVNVVQIDVF